MTNYKNWSKPRVGLMLLMALLSTFLWMSQVNAEPNVPFAVSISGPSSIAADQQATYTITYSGVVSTGGVRYYPPSGFTVTSLSPANNNSSGTTRIWTFNVSGSSGTITIVGQYNSSSCTSGNTTHTGQVYDTHGSGSITDDTHVTTVNCEIATNTPTVTATTTVTPTIEATTTVTPTIEATTTVTPTIEATTTVTPTIEATTTVTPTATATPTATPEPGTISGTVFNDLNGNGIQDSGEAGIAGVTVTLDGTTSTTTDANGNYSFTDVPAGSHTVKESDPANYASTTLNSVLVNVTSAGTAVANFGDILQGTISGSVLNVSGTGIAGVTVELLDSSGNVVATTTTGSNGGYSFANVNAGAYKVRVTDPAGFTAVSSASKTVTIGTDGTATAIFTYQATGTISGVVFNDRNGNETQDNSEGGIADITVTLSNGDTDVTDSNGNYEFTGVAASNGHYDVTISDLGNRKETTSNPFSVSITEASSSATADFGLKRRPSPNTASVYGRYCVARNSNGECRYGIIVIIFLIPDNNNPGRLPDGVRQLQVTTDADGNYAFEDIPIGAYTLRAEAVDNTVPITPLEIPISVAEQESTTVNFGVASTTAVSGVVFTDLDGNGSQSSLESGLAGIQVTLMSGGSQVSTTTTNSNGEYEFDNIDSNNSYNAVITIPDGLVATTATDQSIAPGNFANFGLLSTGTLSGVVYRDQNGNNSLDNTEVGLSGATIELSNGMSTVTNGDGIYEFTGLAAGDVTVTETDPPGFVSTSNMMTVTIAENGSASANFADRRANRVGGKVFNDLNGNGSQDSGEAAFGGVTLELRNASREGIAASSVMTVTSLASGAYEFLNVANGDYTVVVTAPSGFEATTPSEVSTTVTDTQSPVANFGLQQEQDPTALSQPSFNNVMPTTEPFWLALLLLSTVAGLAFYRTRASR